MGVLRSPLSSGRMLLHDCQPLSRRGFRSIDSHLLLSTETVPAIYPRRSSSSPSSGALSLLLNSFEMRWPTFSVIFTRSKVCSLALTLPRMHLVLTFPPTLSTQSLAYSRRISSSQTVSRTLQHLAALSRKLHGRRLPV